MSSYEHLDTKIDLVLAKIGDVAVDGAALKGTAQNNCKNIAEISDKVGKQTGRIGKLEGWRWFVMGAAAAIGTAASAIFKFITK